MANRYWVGGTGTWDTTTTTNWSATSGGGGGASVPTSSDSVFFDQAATYTVTFTGSLNCLDFTASAGTVTFTSSGLMNVYGSMSLIVGTVWSATGGVTFRSTTTGNTVTTNNINMSGSIAFNAVGGGWTLGSDIRCTGLFSPQTGTFDTSSSGNYNITCGTFSTGGTSARTVNLNASTLTVSGSTVTISTTGGGTTFNAGTSQITCSGATVTFAGGGYTFYNVSFTSVAIATISITGANTFNILSIKGRTSGTIGLSTVTLAADQIVNQLSLNFGSSPTNRTLLASSVIGTQRTLTVTTLGATTQYWDFRDIALSGVTLSGTSIGDCKNNSGITFDAAKTVYWASTTSANWNSSTSWSFTSGGASDATAFPLAQDTAVFPSATYPASGSIATINVSYNIGTLDMSGRTSNTLTLATGTTTPSFYGNLVNGTGVTISGTGQVTFAGRVTQTITSAGISFTQPITISSPSGTVTLADAFTTTGTSTTLTNGTLNLAGFNLSTPIFSSNNSNTRAITFSTGSINLTSSTAGTTVLDMGTATNFSCTGTGGFTRSTAATCTMAVGSTAAPTIAPNLSYSSNSALTLTGTYNYFNNITFTGSATVTGLYLVPSNTITLSASGNYSGVSVSTGPLSSLPTIVSNGATLSGLWLQTAGITVVCSDALTLSGQLSLQLGTLKLKSGVTSTIGSLSTPGTTLKYLQSTTPGVQATLSDSSGTNTATYLSIQDSSATGGATWNASYPSCVYVSNNTGWYFGGQNMLLMFP